MANTPAKILEKISACAQVGLDPDQIALLMDVPPEKVKSWLKRKDVINAVKLGRARGNYNVSKANYESAIEGSVQAQKFWLERNAGWLASAKEPDSIIVSGDRVNIYIPDNGRD